MHNLNFYNLTLHYVYTKFTLLLSVKSMSNSPELAQTLPFVPYKALCLLFRLYLPRVLFAQAAATDLPAVAHTMPFYLTHLIRVGSKLHILL